MDAPDYPAALRERWYLLVLGALIGALVAAAVGMALPRGYEASATLFLRVDSAQSSLLERSQFALARIKSYPDLVTSPRVLRATIAELDLDTTAGQLADRVSASNPRDSVLLTVTATAGTPDEAADIANAVAANLSDLVDELENSDARANALVEGASERVIDDVRLELTLPATSPLSPSSPQMTIIVGLGLVTGLALGAIAIAIVARLDPRVRTPRQVRELVGLPVVGQLPRGLDAAARRGVADPRVDEPSRSTIVDLRLLSGTASPEVVVLVPAGRGARARAHAAQLALARTLAASGRTVTSLASTPPEVPRLRSRRHDLADRLTARSRRGAPHITAVPVVALGDTADPGRRETLLRAVAAGIVAHDSVLVSGDADTDLFSIREIDQAKVVVVVDFARSTRRDLVDAVTSLEFAGARPLAVLVTGAPRRARTDLPATWLETDRVEAGPAAVTADLPRLPRRRARRKPRTSAVSLPGLEPEAADPASAPSPSASDATSTADETVTSDTDQSWLETESTADELQVEPEHV